MNSREDWLRARRSGIGGESVDTGMQITMYEPEPDLVDRMYGWALRIVGALAFAAAVGLCAWLIAYAPLWII